MGWVDLATLVYLRLCPWFDHLWHSHSSNTHASGTLSLAIAVAPPDRRLWSPYFQPEFMKHIQHKLPLAQCAWCTKPGTYLSVHQTAEEQFLLTILDSSLSFNHLHRINVCSCMCNHHRLCTDQSYWTLPTDQSYWTLPTLCVRPTFSIDRTPHCTDDGWKVPTLAAQYPVESLPAQPGVHPSTPHMK